MNDFLLALTIGIVLSLTAWAVAKKANISVVPFIVIAPVLVAVGLVTQVPMSPLYIGLQDGAFYREWGYAIEESWRSGEEVMGGRTLWPGKGFWPLLIAVFYSIAGPVLISLIVFNALLVAFSTMFLQKATALLFNINPRLVFIVLTLSSPPILLNGPTLLREGIFWLGISASVCGLAYLHKRNYVVASLTLLSGISVILAIRPNLGVIIAYLIVFVALAIWIFQSNAGVRSRVISGSVASLMLAFSFPPAFSYLAWDISTVGDRANRVAQALSGDDVTTSIKDPPQSMDAFLESTLGASIVRFPSLVFGPFWWEVGPEPIWLVVIGSTLHYLLVLATSSSLLFLRRYRNIPTLLLFGVSAIILVTLSAVVTNYGTLIRFRVVAEVLLVPLSATFITFAAQRLRSHRV